MECTVTTKSAEEEIDPALILPNPAQPRRDFPEDELYQLADSIRRYGILQPLTVRRRYGDSGVLYELIAGERRLRAAVIAGLVTARTLLIMTSTEGIYADPKDPKTLIRDVEARTPEEMERKIRELQTYCMGASRAGANGAHAKLEYALGPAMRGTTVIIGHGRHRISDLLEGRVACTRIGLV